MSCFICIMKEQAACQSDRRILQDHQTPGRFGKGGHLWLNVEPCFVCVYVNLHMCLHSPTLQRLIPYDYTSSFERQLQRFSEECPLKEHLNNQK